MNFNQAKKNISNSNDLQWDIDRYLLSDPTLDRDVFEQRMFVDLALAEQVAVSVEDLQAITSVARSASASAAFASSRNFTSRYKSAAFRWTLLATAAALLIAVSAWQFRSTSSDTQLSLIADNWIAFENLTAAESLELVATEGHPSDYQHASALQPSENQVDTESYEQSDWLVEAAREFYLANNDGAGG